MQCPFSPDKLSDKPQHEVTVEQPLRSCDPSAFCLDCGAALIQGEWLQCLTS